MLNFLHFTEFFDLYNNSNDYQLGSVISQEGKPIAVSTKNVVNAQLNYIFNDKEVLGITESLKNFRHIFLGKHIRIYTNYKNLSYSDSQFNSDRRLR